jgi:hypothetical protein
MNHVGVDLISFPSCLFNSEGCILECTSILSGYVVAETSFPSCLFNRGSRILIHTSIIRLVVSLCISLTLSSKIF